MKARRGRNAYKRLVRSHIRKNLYGKPGGWKRALRNGIAPWHDGTDCGDAGL